MKFLATPLAVAAINLLVNVRETATFSIVCAASAFQSCGRIPLAPSESPPQVQRCHCHLKIECNVSLTVFEQRVECGYTNYYTIHHVRHS